MFHDTDEKTKTMTQLVWEQFKEHRLALASLIVIGIFLMTAVCAPLLQKVTGIGPDDQNVFNRYQPLMSQETPQSDPFSTVSEDTDSRTSASVESSIATSARKLHILGTDELGRDVLMRLVYGARVSIGIGLLVSLASAILGLLIGALAGVYGGWIDTVLMRLTDSLLSLPLLPILIVFAAIDLNKIPFFQFIAGYEGQSIIKLVFILCIFSWMTVARLVRSSILSIKEREFILAARTMGASQAEIITTHMVPNILAPLLVAVTLNVGQSILSEAALSFLGLGIQPPTPSWGNMLFNAQEIIAQAPTLAIFPGLLILIVVVCFNFLGDGLQNAVDPKALRR